MATNFARSSGQKSTTKAQAQQLVLKAISDGLTREEAMRSVGRSLETYKKWMDEPAFRQSVDGIRTARTEMKAGRPALPPFPEFCLTYMRQPLFDHQLRMFDVIEGHEPRDMHEAMVYEPGDPERILINVPPNHAKTITWSINYATYLIAGNPDIKIALISKKQELAKQMLGAIKQRLTSDLYREMWMRFGPEGGFQDPDNSWTQEKIYVSGKGDGEKDPTVQALGMGGTVYGARLDVVFLDDVVDLENAAQYEKQQDWLLQEVDSRLPPDGGKMIVLGTRVAPIDLYKNLRELHDDLDEDSDDPEGSSVFTYFSQPAVLDYGEGPADWVPLWPYSNVPLPSDKRNPPVLACRHCGLRVEENASCVHHELEELYERWNGKRLARRRARIGERKWQLVWMQVDVPDTATFPMRAVEASVNGMRMPGPLLSGAAGHRQNGMDGLYVVAGLDPATVGNTAMVVSALDRSTSKRYILDAVNRPDMHAQHLIAEVQRLTEKYHIHEWVIERNAAQRFITQIPQIQDWLRARGVRVTPHNTNVNKFDADFGTQAMAQLFLTCGEPPSGNRIGAKWKPTPEKALIELPSPKASGWVQQLIAQLITWEPSGMTRRQKTDLVMALWFTEIAFQKMLHRNQAKTHFMNVPFTTKGQKAKRRVINLRAIREAKVAGATYD